MSEQPGRDDMGRVETCEKKKNRKFAVLAVHINLPGLNISSRSSPEARNGETITRRIASRFPNEVILFVFITALFRAITPCNVTAIVYCIDFDFNSWKNLHFIGVIS